jgi:hypothetical protein
LDFCFKKWPIASTFVLWLTHVLSPSQQKKTPFEAIFGMVMLLSHQRSFARLPPMTQLAHNVLCLL